VDKKESLCSFFCRGQGMPFFHHVSHALSREAKRLDRAWLRGTLASALPELSASSSVPFPFLFFLMSF
jgi:hypothetical protein